jgi:hypothetical protein
MVFNATFNNISVISVLLVEETGVPWENHRSVASHWQTLSNNVVSSTLRHEWGSNSKQFWFVNYLTKDITWRTVKIKVPDLPYIEFFNIYASYIFILKHCYSGCKIYSNAINMGIYLNCFEFEPHSWRSVLDTTLFDKVCQWRGT